MLIAPIKFITAIETTTSSFLDFKILEAAAIAEEVVGHSLWGHVSKAGANPHDDACYPNDMPFVETLQEASHFRNGPAVYEGQISPWREGDALTRASNI